MAYDRLLVDRSNHDELIRVAKQMAAKLHAIRTVVEEQAEDEGLWFIPETCPEAYLMQELRRLHAVIEGTDAAVPGDPADPYATWDPDRATDLPDGLPDRAIVPLVEELRSRGIVTLQSCAGHEGSDDGHLWVLASSVSEQSVRVLDRSAFERIGRVIWPEDRWEIVWLPSQSASAIDALYQLRPGDPAGTPHEEETRDG